VCAQAAGLYLDYFKNRVADETTRLLVALAEGSGVPERRDAMFRGGHINVSEDRLVLHVALRKPVHPGSCPGHQLVRPAGVELGKVLASRSSPSWRARTGGRLVDQRADPQVPPGRGSLTTMED
jgi:glucose-6-phosphate isomerase